MTHTVSAVARLAGITVRTLHHYDEIGLLSPSERSGAGYRLYTGNDLDRLQQVLFYRELGFGLDDIRQAMEGPRFDRLDALRRQRTMLLARADRLSRMIGAVDAAIRAEETGVKLTEQEKFEVFGDFDPADHEAEVEERWGETDAFAESRRRTSRYSKDDWKQIQDEAAAISKRLAGAMQSGVDPESEQAMALVDQHRQHIDRWFYPCSKEMHGQLAQMWLADQRFRDNIDATAEGLTDFMAAAAIANAAS